MALESMMAATNRKRPPQSGHSRTSMSRPRRMSSAQVRHGTPSRLVPLLGPAFSTCRRSIALERSGEWRRNAGGRHPWHVCGLALPEALAANKPKALSAARGDWDISDVLQSHILPQQVGSLSGAERRYLSSTVTRWHFRDTRCRAMAHSPLNAPHRANRRQDASEDDSPRQKTTARNGRRQGGSPCAVFIAAVLSWSRSAKEHLRFAQLFPGQNR
jgi:hypothetical protein